MMTASQGGAGLRITVLGEGAWGSTLRRLWQGQGHQLRSWTRSRGEPPEPLLLNTDLVVSAVSMAGVDALAARLAPHWPAELPLLSCSKGIDPVRLSTASRIWQQQLMAANGAAAPALAVLSGPNLADELDRNLPAASVIASQDPLLATRLQRQLAAPNLRLYTNADPVGTEAAGALKNVMAVAAGISDGLGLGANAKASLLCRGLAEIGVVVDALGGQPATLYGLAGLGDLLATANSPLSRNYRFGQLLAEGIPEQAAVSRIGATVEGPRTARAALVLAQELGFHLPICEQIEALLAGRVQVREVVPSLMRRDPRAEVTG
jgi:glycerol-3-phosphate dehydrogenase (NAD(P)+)